MARLTRSLVAMGVLSLLLAAVAVGCSDDKEVKVVETVLVEKEVVVEVIATVAPLSKGIQIEQGKYGGTLRVTAQASIKTLDPEYTGAYVTAGIGIHIWERLFAWDDDFVAQPQQVDTWSVSSDGTVFTFNIRDGLVFHNGDPVTVDDIIPSVERAIGRHPPMRNLGKVLKGFAKVDADTFTMELTEPYGEVLASLGRIRRSGSILPAKIAAMPATEDVGEDNIIGSGPYKLASWRQGDRVTLERHELFNPRSDPPSNLAGAQLAYLDSIVWIQIPDEEVKIAGLKTGEWEVVDSAALDFFGDMNANPDIDVATYSPGHLSGMWWNHKTAPANDKKFRQAVQAAIDAEAFMTSLGPSDLWLLCPALFFCGTPWESTARADLYNVNNMELARKLLAESDYDGEPVFHLNPTDYATLTPMGPVWKRMLEDIGINVEMPAMDWATAVSTRLNDPTWNSLTMWCVHSNNMDPLTNCYQTVGGLGGYENPTLAELQLKWAKSSDLVEKKGIVDKIQALFYEEAINPILGSFFSINPYSKDLKNFAPQGVKGMAYFLNTWLEE